jgi:hypothetical protein
MVLRLASPRAEMVSPLAVAGKLVVELAGCASSFLRISKFRHTPILIWKLSQCLAALIGTLWVTIWRRA